MRDEAGFLKSIADQPAERSTRLVYADWLDENNRAREAEFLRLQIQAAELNAKRLFELGGELDAKWLTAVGAVGAEPECFIQTAVRIGWFDHAEIPAMALLRGFNGWRANE